MVAAIGLIPRIIQILHHSSHCELWRAPSHWGPLIQVELLTKTDWKIASLLFQQKKERIFSYLGFIRKYLQTYFSLVFLTKIAGYIAFSGPFKSMFGPSAICHGVMKY